MKEKMSKNKAFLLTGRSVEMKIILGGNTPYEILSAARVG